ncbi:MAG: hydroxymethylbilane synthase [Pseudomonadota bacterium]
MAITMIKIGTRSSPLALVQANMVKAALENVRSDIDVQIVPIKSNADWKKADGEKPLNDQEGGKGLFAKEIETQILDGTVDIGVHSAKDMASFLPEGLAIDHFLPREDARDAFISLKYQSIEDLPEGSVIGTCSPRRQSFFLEKHPDCNVVPFRGNVQTRLDKVRDGQVDATFLAMAGIKRLGIDDPMIKPFAVEEMLPAAGQGAVCIETKPDDAEIRMILDEVNCTRTRLSVVAERAVLQILDGSCQTPIAAHSVFDGDTMTLKAKIGDLQGQNQHISEMSALVKTSEEAASLGRKVGEELKAQ